MVEGTLDQCDVLNYLDQRIYEPFKCIEDTIAGWQKYVAREKWERIKAERKQRDDILAIVVSAYGISFQVPCQFSTSFRSKLRTLTDFPRSLNAREGNFQSSDLYFPSRVLEDHQDRALWDIFKVSYLEESKRSAPTPIMGHVNATYKD